MKEIEGGITAPVGFQASGIHAGIKKERPDLALLLSDSAAAIAGVFTTNKVCAAPVRLCREKLGLAPARAVVVNSGNANACTGPQGMADARKMVSLAAKELGIDEKSVYVCSTGTIGRPLPIERIEEGIRKAASELDGEGGAGAAAAILTTDTVTKEAAVEIHLDGKPVRIGGMAKGSGMIEPHMATLLAFITTDAAVKQNALQSALARAAEKTFNRITVDGSQSTNDSVLLLANGAAGNGPLDPDHEGWTLFCEALEGVARSLARKIVEDAEGATKAVTVVVKGAASPDDAERVARAIATSALVKTSWYGGDPNWGRIIDAVGYSGAEVREDRIDIYYGDLCAVKQGQGVAGCLADLENVLKEKQFVVTVDLHMGDAESFLWTCDYSEEYVRINSEYTT